MGSEMCIRDSSLSNFGTYIIEHLHRFVWRAVQDVADAVGFRYVDRRGVPFRDHFVFFACRSLEQAKHVDHLRGSFGEGESEQEETAAEERTHLDGVSCRWSDRQFIPRKPGQQ